MRLAPPRFPAARVPPDYNQQRGTETSRNSLLGYMVRYRWLTACIRPTLRG